MFKREIHYKDLPTLFINRKKNLPLDCIENKDIGLCELFKPSNGTT